MSHLRRIQLISTLGFLAVLGIASLADSGVGSGGMALMRSAFMGLRMIPGGGLGIGLVSALPFAADTISHFLAWTAVGLLAAGLAQGFVERINLAVTLFALSAMIEIGQQYLSSSRMAEVSDLLANGVGLTVGFIGAGFVGAAIRSLLSSLPAKNSPKNLTENPALLK